MTTDQTTPDCAIERSRRSARGRVDGLYKAVRIVTDYMDEQAAASQPPTQREKARFGAAREIRERLYAAIEAEKEKADAR